MLNSPARHESTAFPSRFAFLSTSAAMERTGIACATPVISLQKLKNFLTQPRFRFPHHGEYHNTHQQQQHTHSRHTRGRPATPRDARAPKRVFSASLRKQIQKQRVLRLIASLSHCVGFQAIFAYRALAFGKGGRD